MRNSWLLFTIFALIAFTSAIDVDGIAEYFHQGKRQAASGTGNVDPSTSAPPVPSTSAPVSTPAPTPTPTPTPTPSEPVSEPPSSQPPSSAPPSSAAPSTKGPATSAAPSSNAPSKTQARSTEIVTSALLGTSVQPYTTVYKTVSNGVTQEMTSVGSRTSVFSTGQAVITKTPQSGDNNGGGGGLTDSNKKIIGGVVGGVGGAILLGGLAIVAWRLRSKRRVSEDDADLMAGTGSALGDKPAPQPFQSNLEQYHNPGGRPNAAANF
ncbi:hypothetical protein BCR34DRAFT_625806 [Clohesyomyces aquaticus]|uniref:Mid2 domain-containing protein n=1 Tax=Clohesyomyces aquaticus TaxID=1231657 RepID=A0A1Y1ZGL1_9PLEO|nr:hypothetical protein BCR34DRAFT_625806 [Clohesyomyces aquaticus]